MRCCGLPLGSIPFQKYSGTEKSPEQFFRLLQEEGRGKREEGRRKILLCLSFKEALSGQLSAFPRTAAQTALSRFFLRCCGLPLGSIPFQKYSGTEKSPEQFFRLLSHSCQIFEQIFFEMLWFTFG
ncbi:hypothetical protein [Okeania sp. SIO2B3]|uniref:hypothetical protein n=1 Tax=Okeania sp. SIO2B3 TaxID=2607784 RepID=UPI0013C1EBAB|nr:hypothetical protein [Okeania sp. SIO2B3]NET41483.1 hypothetical protein [Okeania sp. SIO2B3]